MKKFALFLFLGTLGAQAALASDKRKCRIEVKKENPNTFLLKQEWADRTYFTKSAWECFLFADTWAELTSKKFGGAEGVDRETGGKYPWVLAVSWSFDRKGWGKTTGKISPFTKTCLKDVDAFQVESFAGDLVFRADCSIR